MKALRWSRNAAAMAVALAVVLIGLAPEGWAITRTKQLYFEELVKDADAIVVAECVERETVFKDGTIKTIYRFRPNEFLKGSMTLNKSGEFVFEEIGGALSGSVPLATYSQGMVNFNKGEETMLFMGQSKRAKAKGIQKMHIMGRNVGCYRVVSDPSSGEKRVVRAQGAVISAPAGATVASSEAVSDAKVKVIEGSLAERAERSRARRDKKAEENPAIKNEIYDFESLDSVRDRIRTKLLKSEDEESKD